MKVLKFGGTSVGSIESIREVTDIIRTKLATGEPIAVVFSAMGGFTNQLIEMGQRATRTDDFYTELLKKAEERHFDVVRTLVDVQHQGKAMATVKGLFNELEDLLHGIFLIQELSSRTLDLLVSFGERLSTTIITEVVKSQGIDAEMLDARQVIKTNDHFTMADVDFGQTNALIKAHFEQTNALQLITGFIGSTGNGTTTTLGRGGSDYTGSIFGAALDAEEIEIWTDVDGMMTADPRKVPNAFTIPTITYAEAMELSHFGAKVIYPPSLQPAFKKNIPIRILNTFNRNFVGTLISRHALRPEYTITGVSSIDKIALVNVQGSGMIGVAGISARLFSALARHKINVILISQASSEHSICFAIDPHVASKTQEILNDAFSEEIKNGWIDAIDINRELSIIAIVGEGMRLSSGISGRLFSVLGKNGVNIVATAQGSSELNISVVIPNKDISKALNSLHDSFFESQVRTLHLFVAGTGLIGKTLLHQIDTQATYLKQNKGLKIKLVGISNSKKMLVNPNGITLDSWEQQLIESNITTSTDTFVEAIKEMNLPNSIFVDNTANKTLPNYYIQLFNANVSVVTPNKVANSGSYQEYLHLKNTARKRGVKFLYETNVGAGLPVINTLNSLKDSGDSFLKIEAVLSGTLSFIFNTFEKGTSFANIVKEAKAKGYTEPDPREDLSGMDVARKILILAREVGLPLEPSDVNITPLLPQNCLDAPTVEAFFEELEKSNEVFESWIEKANQNQQKLRFIAQLKNGKASLSLQYVGIEHPFYALSGADNIVAFTTERYNSRPLVIKGPGAGAAVTATGVFADIISIGSYLA